MVSGAVFGDPFQATEQWYTIGSGAVTIRARPLTTVAHRKRRSTMTTTFADVRIFPRRPDESAVDVVVDEGRITAITPAGADRAGSEIGRAHV